MMATSTNSIFAFLIFMFISSCTKLDKTSFILRDVEIINIYNGQVSINSILIENDIIKQIGSFNDLNKNKPVKILNCKGKYVIPGIFDMHTHIFEHENSVSFLDSMLLNGIIGIRDMGGNPDSIAMIKSQIKSGIIQGPDIFLTGYTFDGEKDRDELDPTTIIVDDFTNLEKIVDKLHGLNVDFIKVHNYFPHYRLEELIQIASQRDLRVVGHIPYGTGPHEAINLGMYSIEHVNSFIGSLVTTEGNDVNTITQAFTTLDSSYVSELSQLMVNNHTAFTPTLHIINKGYQSSGDENSRKLGGLMMDRFLPMVKSMNDQGVLLLAGSDDVPINEENYGAIHKEIEWLVKAGLSNLEALQTATINPAKFLKIENEYGSIEVNKKATLLF